MAETITATAKAAAATTEVVAVTGVEATIMLSSNGVNPTTTFTIAIIERSGATTKTTSRSPGGSTKVPGGPSAMAIPPKGCIFEVRTEPYVDKVVLEPEDGRTKVTIDALIKAKDYENRAYTSWESERFRAIDFSESPRNISADAAVQINASYRDNDDIELQIIYYV